MATIIPGGRKTPRVMVTGNGASPPKARSSMTREEEKYNDAAEGNGQGMAEEGEPVSVSVSKQLYSAVFYHISTERSHLRRYLQTRLIPLIQEVLRGSSSSFLCLFGGRSDRIPGDMIDRYTQGLATSDGRTRTRRRRMSWLT